MILFVQYLVSKFGPGSIIQSTADGATPLHIAAGVSLLERVLGYSVIPPFTMQGLDTSAFWNTYWASVNLIQNMWMSWIESTLPLLMMLLKVAKQRPLLSFWSMVLILISRTWYGVVQYVVNNLPLNCSNSPYQEEKSPIDLATEQNHTEILNLITDFKQNGQAALIKYKRNRAKKDGSAQVQ